MLKIFKTLILISEYAKRLNNQINKNINNINDIYEIKKIFRSGYRIPPSIDYIIPYILFSTRVSKDGCIFRKVEIKIHFLEDTVNEFEWFIPLQNNRQLLKGLCIRINNMPISHTVSYSTSLGSGRTALIRAKIPPFQKGKIKLLTLEYYINNYMERIRRKRILYSRWKYPFMYKAIRPTLKIEMRIYLPSDYRLVKFQSSQTIEYIELKYQDELIVIWEKEGLKPQEEVTGMIEYDCFHPAIVPLITVISGVVITAIVGLLAKITFLNILYLSIIVGVFSAIVIMLSLLFIRRTGH